MTELRTDRLTLRGWHDDDLDAVTAMNADPEVMRYIRDGSVLDRDGSAAALRRWRNHWVRHGFGLFAVEVRETGELAGWAGLAVPEFLPEVLPAVEIGWRLDRRFWGHGYATEAATAAMAYAFTDRGLDRLVSIRHPDNVRSRRVMDKLGLTYEFSTVVPVIERPVAVHAITRQTFSNGRSNGSP